jgi:hypothetical protein
MNVSFLFIPSKLSLASKANPSNPNTLQKEAKSMKLYLVIFPLILGIKAGKTQNPDELKKLSKQLKEETFKHPEVGILPVGEIERMKVAYYLIIIEHDP